MPQTMPYEIGVCSWSLQVTSVPELVRLHKRLGGNLVVQIACGDPHHASWVEGESLPAAVRPGDLATAAGVTLAFETGQETADLLRRTLDDLRCPNLKVNFDPANMLLYDMGDPLRAVEILGPDIRSVHAKDARRPKVKGTWGEEVPLGEGEVNVREWVRTLWRVGYCGPLCVEREVGDQEQRVADITHGINYLRQCTV